MRRIQDSSSNHREQTPERSPPNNPNDSSRHAHDTVWEISSTHTDGRTRVDVIDKVLEPSNTCSHKITNIIYERLEPTRYNWKAVSKETKDFYFEEFKKYFVWKPELSDNVVRDAWLQSAILRYSNLCSSAHALWEKKKESNKIGRDVWDRWAQQWNTPEFKEKSKVQKQNRNSGVNERPSTHTGGSRSHRTHATDLEAIEDLLKKHSQNVDGSPESQLIDEVEVYYDVVGGRNKMNRVYGIGSSQSIFYGLGKGYSNAAYGTSQIQNEDHQMMQAKLHDMEDQMKAIKEKQESHLKAIQEQQEEQLKAIQEEHQERLTMLEYRFSNMLESVRHSNLP